MQVTVDSPDMGQTQGMKHAIEKAGKKVSHYMDGLAFDCTLRKEAKGVHVLLKFKPRHGKEVQAEGRHWDFYHALGVAQRRIIRQVTDQKGKLESQRKHPQESIQDIAPDAENESEAA